MNTSIPILIGTSPHVTGEWTIVETQERWDASTRTHVPDRASLRVVVTGTLRSKLAIFPNNKTSFTWPLYSQNRRLDVKTNLYRKDVNSSFLELKYALHDDKIVWMLGSPIKENEVYEIQLEFYIYE
jgi:hypothetical protein